MQRDVTLEKLACMQALGNLQALFATTLLVLRFGAGVGGPSVGPEAAEVAIAAAHPAAEAPSAVAAGAAPIRGRGAPAKKRVRRPQEQQQAHQQEVTPRQRHKARRKGSSKARQRSTGEAVGGEDARMAEDVQAADGGEETPREHQQQQQQHHCHPQQQQQQQREQQQQQQGAEGEAEAAPATVEIYKFWQEEEENRLMQCVDDVEYRRQHLGAEALDWVAIGAHFHRSEQAVRSKYRHECIMREGAGADGLSTEQRAQARPRERTRLSISYGWMALYALSTLPGQEGTGIEICAAVEAHPPFQALLDRSSRPDSNGVPRWRQRIREELSHRAYIEGTGVKRTGQVVWRLRPDLFDALPASQRKKLSELNLRGLPFLGKNGQQN